MLQRMSPPVGLPRRGLEALGMKIPFIEPEDGEPLRYGRVRHWIWFHLFRPATQFFWRTVGCPRERPPHYTKHGGGLSYCPQCGYNAGEAYW